jgi:peptidoglycan/xylan/chitin deacetylase (PgdA/CDA1 family)
MGPQDGVDQLILALELLARRREQDDWQAILVGQGADKARLEQMTLQKGLQHRIRFVGWVPPTEVVSYIAAMDICAVPDPKNQYTDHSTLIKVMEYMAQRKPVVAFDLTETRYSLGEGGLYAHSVDEFSRAIGQLLDDGLLRNDLGQKGYDRAWKTLAWHRQVGNLIEIYRSLFEGDPAPMGSQGRPSLSRTSAILDRSSSESELGWRSPFPFPPALAAFLERSFVADKKNARLSHAYRMFYRLRPCVPATLRQALQRLNRTRSSESANPFMPGDLEEVLEQVGWNRSVWPEQANLALVLTHDVETSYGMSRIARLAEAEEKLGFRSCWNIVPYKYDIDLGLMRDLRERGFELGVHGYNHDGRLFFSKKIFDERVPGIHDASDRFQATGFRAPMVHRNLDWMQALDMEYDSSCFDLDPFQAMPGGVRTFWPFLYGRFVELPYTLPQDHTLFVVLGESTSRLWKEKLSMIRKWQGMALMLTHPDYLDSPSRLSMYLDFLKFLRDESTFWHVLPRDMARWVRQQ